MYIYVYRTKSVLIQFWSRVDILSITYHSYDLSAIVSVRSWVSTPTNSSMLTLLHPLLARNTRALASLEEKLFQFVLPWWFCQLGWNLPIAKPMLNSYPGVQLAVDKYVALTIQLFSITSHREHVQVGTWSRYLSPFVLSKLVRSRMNVDYRRLSR